MENNRLKRTILLRGIDPIKLYLEYMSGITEHISIPNGKVEITKGIKLDYDTGKNMNDNIYEFKDASNNTRRVFTTNVKDYNECIRIFKPYEQNNKSTYTRLSEYNNKIVKCDYCNKKINKKESLGIPLKLDIENDKNGKCKSTLFHVEGNYCSFEHLYDVIKNKIMRPYNDINCNYSKVDHNVRIMFNLMYPNRSFIKMAFSPSLLNENGGSLKREDYDSGEYNYIPTPGLILLPTKQQFIQINYT
uniref:A1L transcription factor/late transcription factor VLTF-2 n=1 Tax=Pithovirus LCPAC102 TaxID=2506587 RepID=A0A481Z2W8_9VIRU|nr:MAG: A1L transcription factor/late transcription factor VLTF-2 [Pithovirus LCPAC102]